jgi:hypothetical protein
MNECRRCAEEVDREFRYCPWCGAPLRIKVTELFGGADGKALRVSRYFGDEDTPAQLRFSIWSGESADAVISLSTEEAERLSRFVGPLPLARKPLLDQIRESLRL